MQRGTNRPYADAAIAHAAFTRSCGEEYSVAQHFRQSSRSNRSSAQDLKLTIRCTVHEFTCSGTKGTSDTPTPKSATAPPQAVVDCSKIRSSAAFPKCTSMASMAFRGIQGQLFGTMLAFSSGRFLSQPTAPLTFLGVEE